MCIFYLDTSVRFRPATVSNTNEQAYPIIYMYKY